MLQEEINMFHIKSDDRPTYKKNLTGKKIWMIIVSLLMYKNQCSIM